MKPLTAKQAAEWCRTLGVPADPQSGPAAEILADHFQLPDDADRRAAVGAEKVAHFDNASGILIWITGWGIWPSIDRSDDFRAIRAEVGEDRCLHEIPAQLLTKIEFDYVRRMADCAVDSLWDLYGVLCTLAHITRHDITNAH